VAQSDGARPGRIKIAGRAPLIICSTCLISPWPFHDSSDRSVSFAFESAQAIVLNVFQFAYFAHPFA
jgi:hypothetical protein